jgi:hypothetical protein
MRGWLETIALVGVVAVLAALVLVSIISASILAAGRTTALDEIDVFGSDADLYGQGGYPCATYQLVACQ